MRACLSFEQVQSMSISVNQSINQSINLAVYLAIYVSVHLFFLSIYTHPSVYLRAHLCLSLCVCVCVCVFVCVRVCASRCVCMYHASIVTCCRLHGHQDSRHGSVIRADWHRNMSCLISTLCHPLVVQARSASQLAVAVSLQDNGPCEGTRRLHPESQGLRADTVMILHLLVVTISGRPGTKTHEEQRRFRIFRTLHCDCTRRKCPVSAAAPGV